MFVVDTEMGEQAMFGAREFLVADRVAVAASADGGLMVRVDPAHAEQPLKTTAAQPITMRDAPCEVGSIDDHHVRARRRLGKWSVIGTAAVTSTLGATCRDLSSSSPSTSRCYAGFSPLETGTRILPVALSIAVGSVVGGVLAPRIGTRAVDVSGLVSFGTAMAWIASSIDTDTPFWTTIVAQMLLMGIGIGLISTPATESVMLVLPPARAGIGSAVNDATRELGSTLGVAVVGSLFSSTFGAHLADSAFAATGKPVKPLTRYRSRSESPPTTPRS